MNLANFIALLSANPAKSIQVVLPDQSLVPAHFHVTEIGRVRKDFIDCGGTVRHTENCVLQTWVANDVEHRLDTTKLAKIVDKGVELFGTTDIPLEVEYDNGVISQYPVLKAEVTESAVALHVGTKHTACLAEHLCGIGLDLLPTCSEPGCC